ncbi:MAG: flippase-like domain-containing protein [Candidatus Cloacimonetes bacterium]|nr:flippase-like domain-containing protein [Candidatus Cloacimonadota bacterium]
MKNIIVRTSFRSHLIRIGISLGILILVLIRYYPAGKSSLFQVTSSRHLVLAILVSLILIQVLAAWRWRLFLLAVKSRERFSNLLLINLKSLFWGLFLPSADGYALIRIYLLERKNPRERGKAGGSVITEKFLGALILGLLALIFNLLNRRELLSAYLLLFAALIMITGIILWVFLGSRQLSVLLTKRKYKKGILGAVLQYLNTLQQALAGIKWVKIFWIIIPVVITVQIFSILCVALIFAALGVSLPLLYHLAILPVIQILTLIPITFNGFGMREGLFIQVYGGLGISPGVSFSASIIYFLVLACVPALIGGIITIALPGYHGEDDKEGSA